MDNKLNNKIRLYVEFHKKSIAIDMPVMKFLLTLN